MMHNLLASCNHLEWLSTKRHDDFVLHDATFNEVQGAPCRICVLLTPSQSPAQHRSRKRWLQASHLVNAAVDLACSVAAHQPATKAHRNLIQRWRVWRLQQQQQQQQQVTDMTHVLQNLMAY
jgi:hypothetical protein